MLVRFDPEAETDWDAEGVPTVVVKALKEPVTVSVGGILYVTSIEVIRSCVLVVFAFLIFKLEVDEIPVIV